MVNRHELSGHHHLGQFGSLRELQYRLLGLHNITKRVDSGHHDVEEDPAGPDLLGDPEVPPVPGHLGTGERLAPAVHAGGLALVLLGRPEVDELDLHLGVDHDVLILSRGFKFSLSSLSVFSHVEIWFKAFP